MAIKKRLASNAKSHELSLRRRSFCVRKKAYELAVLCDASVCLMQFDQGGQLTTFPEDVSEVNNVLKHYLHSDGKVPEKRKIYGSNFHGDEANRPDSVLSDVHENTKGCPPSLGAELLDTKSALELQSLELALDVKMKKLEERIKLLKDLKCRRKEQKISTMRCYGDGTPFNPDDLQLGVKFCSSESFSKQDGLRLAGSPPDPSLSDHRLRSTANNVIGDSFSFTEQSPRQVEQKVSTMRCYGDGTPFNPDDLQLGDRFCSSESCSKQDGLRLAGCPPDPSNHRLRSTANNVVGDSFSFTEQSPTDSSSCDSGSLKMYSAQREHVSQEDLPVNDSMNQRHQKHDLHVREGTNLRLRSSVNAREKQKAAPLQPCHQDGMHCFSKDHNVTVDFHGSGSPFFHGYRGPTIYPASVSPLPVQSISSELPYSNGPSSVVGSEMDSAMNTIAGRRER